MPERANFSATEYEYLRDRWGSKKTRLGGDSMRNFDQCALCLSTAVSPMACREGHLFCKECILTNLLKQKDDIREHQLALKQLAVEQENERERARERARERVVRDFERGYRGDGSGKAGSSSSSIGEGVSAGVKRKASDEGDVVVSGASSLASLPEKARRVAQEAEDKAQAAIEEEQRLSRLKKLPAFWLPSLTPGEKEGKVDLKQLETALEPRCRVTSEHGHKISIKSLTPVTFSRAPQSVDAATSSSSSSSSSPPTLICPGCKKGLSNSQRLFTIRKCSHTFCSHCADQLIYGPVKLAAKQVASAEKEKAGQRKKGKAAIDSSSLPLATCPECTDGTISNIERDVIALYREGTGYASAGGVEGKKKGIAFQG